MKRITRDQATAVIAILWLSLFAVCVVYLMSTTTCGLKGVA